MFRSYFQIIKFAPNINQSSQPISNQNEREPHQTTNKNSIKDFFNN